MKKRLLFLLLLLPTLCFSQTVNLQGKVQLANAQNFNGFLRLKLSGSNIKNICTPPPYRVVPTLAVSYQISNGQLVNGTGNFLSQDCMSPKIPYYVEVADNNNVVQGTDNWYLPRTVTGIVDIGNMSEENLGGPINVAIPGGIITNPGFNQSITQPTGTSFTFNGIVNINGPINFATTPTFSTIKASQVLVGGLTSSAYPLDVQGYIDATSGYLVNGNGGTIGQCLTSDSVSFKPGACGAAFPTLYYQTIQAQALVQNQRSALNFSNSFVVYDDTANNSTDIGLGIVGTAGTYTNVKNITTDVYGRVTGVTVQAAANTRTCSGTSCYIMQGDGTLEQWGTIALPGGSTPSITVTFPVSFNSAALSAGRISVVTSLSQKCSTGSDSGYGISPTNLTTAGFVAAGEIDPGACSGTTTVYWRAIGY